MAYQWTPPAPNERTAFSQVLPYDKVFNPQLVNQLALSQLQPEVNRQQDLSRSDLWRGLANTGGYRTGNAQVANQRLVDNYSRMLKEQSSDFTGRINDWATDWYNRQSENYYKNPSAYVMPKLPTFEEFMGGQGGTAIGGGASPGNMRAMPTGGGQQLQPLPFFGGAPIAGGGTGSPTALRAGTPMNAPFSPMPITNQKPGGSWFTQPLNR